MTCTIAIELFQHNVMLCHSFMRLHKTEPQICIMLEYTLLPVMVLHCKFIVVANKFPFYLCNAKVLTIILIGCAQISGAVTDVYKSTRPLFSSSLGVLLVRLQHLLNFYRTM